MGRSLALGLPGLPSHGNNNWVGCGAQGQPRNSGNSPSSTLWRIKPQQSWERKLPGPRGSRHIGQGRAKASQVAAHPEAGWQSPGLGQLRRQEGVLLHLGGGLGPGHRWGT